VLDDDDASTGRDGVVDVGWNRVVRLAVDHHFATLRTTSRHGVRHSPDLSHEIVHHDASVSLIDAVTSSDVVDPSAFLTHGAGPASDPGK
jgi:hypothetical protein